MPATPFPSLLATCGGAGTRAARVEAAAAVKLVVADNDSDALDLLVTDLTLEGHDVAGTASGGERALELVRELAPEALVVDFRMPPGPNGVDTAARARAEQPSLRIILYTNYVNT